MPVTIVLADDHPMIRLGVRTSLEAEADLQVVGETGEALEVVPLVERLQPAVLIVDLMMPGMSGLEITRQVTKRSPATRVIILSMHANEAYVIEALRNGAAAYVLKGSAASELLHAIREVCAGRRYLSPPLSERAIETYIEKSTGAPVDSYDRLSTREREVLHLAAEGLTNAEIGTRLFIGTRTVETHRANFMHKLDLNNQTDLIRYALRRGILPPEK